MIPPPFPDYKIEQISKLIQSSDIHRNKNEQNKLQKTIKSYSGHINTNVMSKASPNISNMMSKPTMVQKINDTFRAKSDKYTITIPTTSTGSIMLKEKLPKASKKAASLQSNPYNFGFSLPNQGSNTFSGKAKVSNDHSVIYREYQEDTDVAVQAYKDSARILTIINGVNAPTEFTYDVKVPSGGRLKKVKDGGVFVLDKNEKMVGGFAPVWAVDKKGKDIPTHFEIRGDMLIQVVEHLSVNATYPVVADPYGGHRLIWSARWRHQSGRGWKLSVSPTGWARWYNNYTAAYAAWQELVDSDMIFYNFYGMRDQYVCHHRFAWMRPGTYNLEEWRPNVGYDATVRAHCNPI